MSELKSLGEDCGKWPSAAKAALNFRDKSYRTDSKAPTP
jgi:hypothetical protein